MQSHYSDLPSHSPAVTSESRAAMSRARDDPQMSQDSHQGSRNQSAVAPMRSEDSWIEVSSQPSSSSLSSAATTDDIITTGLRVERSVPGPKGRARRKRARQLQSSSTQNSESSRASSVAGTSSQEEYEESDSESDRVLSGSNEDVTTRSRGDALMLPHDSLSEPPSSGDDDEDDDRSAALGPRLASAPFVPQPNVFSHAPQYTRSRSYNGPQTTPSLVSNSSQATAVRHNSSSTVRGLRRNSRAQHTPYNIISPNYQADHDAALRASLSTLLSLGTAVRGVPKNESPPVPAGPPVAPASSFRLVSESVAMGEDAGDISPHTKNDYTADQRYARQPKSVGSNTSSTPSKTKRKSSKDRGSAHATSSKRSRRGNMTDSLIIVNPTFMTWVISAGVVVLFSAISFSAGYALGREVGRTEAGIGTVAGGGATDSFAKVKASVGCSRDAVQGSLKRLRWGSSGAGVSVYN
ncbi:hypothetical protein BGW36DRAFT_300846 [Talaromyces proteolyticus]|uniref:Uncharacterized protein n=1 Tax=Talaromyces proteolyticus TaxID=1131652 RepID=A0AAD4PY16_9EURO|nr:uncharacterized protein BGW36DRAFT_300846 [Talaromyces proteolyticus]KAH8694150.1 hypothetical protein BGW36DRAFT_300846 [Talaromyces proteolyticus]